MQAKLSLIHRCIVQSKISCSVTFGGTPSIRTMSFRLRDTVQHADGRGFACLSPQVRQMDGMLASLEGFL